MQNAVEKMPIGRNAERERESERGNQGEKEKH